MYKVEILTIDRWAALAKSSMYILSLTISDILHHNDLRVSMACLDLLLKFLLSKWCCNPQPCQILQAIKRRLKGVYIS